MGAVWLSFLLASAAGAEPHRQYVIRGGPPPSRPVKLLSDDRELEARVLRAKAQAEDVATTNPRDDVRSLLVELGGPPRWLNDCNAISLWDDRTTQLPAARRRIASLRAQAEAETKRLAELSDARGASADANVLKARAAVFLDALGALEASLDGVEPGLKGRVVEMARACIGRNAASRAVALERQLDGWGQSPVAPVLGVGQLSYLHQSGAPGAPLPSGSLQPAYAGGNRGLAVEDTTADREVVVDAAITAKANELGSPAAIVDFVKHSVRLQWAHGAMKGTDVTLREGVGTPAEIAGLTIALLRARNIPSRYVLGTVEVPVDVVAGTMGLLEAHEVAAQAAGTLVLDSSRRVRVLEVLAASGIPHSVNGADVRLAHVWAEGYLPWGSYRGAAIADEGSQWVPIDAAFWGTPRLERAPARPEVLAGPGRDADSLTAAFLARPRGQQFSSYVESTVSGWLAAQNSALTWTALVSPRSVPRAEHLELLPGVLPHRVVAVASEVAFLPDSWLHFVDVELKVGVTSLLSARLPLHRLTSRRSLLTFKPADAASTEVIEEAGGRLFGTQPSAVQLLPVLRVGGVEVAAGVAPSGFGQSTQLILQVASPSGAVRRFENQLITGNLTALGFGSPSNGFTEGPEAGLEGFAEKWLYGRAARYSSRWTKAEDDFAALMDVTLVRPGPSVVLASFQLSVEESLGVRTRVSFRGVQVDADLRTTIPVGASPTRINDFLTLAGFEGSSLESAVLTEGTREDAISTTGVLQEAAAQGVPVVTVTSANAGSVLPGLSLSSEVRAEVTNAVALGRVVTIPLAPLDVANWRGTGFIVRDPRTRESSYFLSGLVSGGQTVVSPAFWTDQSLVQSLEAAGQPGVNADIRDAARIIMVQIPSIQADRSVDVLAPHTVRAYVTTLRGARVSGVQVRFESRGAAARFPNDGQPCPGSIDVSNALPRTVVVSTNQFGVASARVCPDPGIRNYAYRQLVAGRSPEYVGLDRSRGRHAPRFL